MLQGLGQSAQIPGRGGVQGDAGNHAFDIGGLSQLLANRTSVRAIQKMGDDLMTCRQSFPVAKGRLDPSAEATAAHGRDGFIQHAQQAVAGISGEGLLQLEIAPGGGVQVDMSVAPLAMQARDMRQRRPLCFLCVVQQGSCGPDDGWRILAVESRQVVDTQLLAQEPRGGLDIEMPVREGLPMRILPLRWRIRLRIKDFRRVKTLKFRKQVFDGRKFHHVETARTQVQAGQPDRGVQPQCEQQRVASRVQQFVLDQGAGCDDARDLALHRSPAGRAIANLLADHCGFPELDELGEIGVE